MSAERIFVYKSCLVVIQISQKAFMDISLYTEQGGKEGKQKERRENRANKLITVLVPKHFKQGFSFPPCASENSIECQTQQVL